jgi:hypothetical protein
MKRDCICLVGFIAILLAIAVLCPSVKADASNLAQANGSESVGNNQVSRTGGAVKANSLSRPNIVPYRVQLIRRITKVWQPIGYVDALAIFTIAKDGRLLSGEIILYSGNKNAKALALAAVEAAEYPPLPDWFQEEYLTFTVRLTSAKGPISKNADAGIGDSYPPLSRTTDERTGFRLNLARMIRSNWREQNGPIIRFTLAHTSGTQKIQIVESSGDNRLDGRALKLMHDLTMPVLNDAFPEPHATFRVDLATMFVGSE